MCMFLISLVSLVCAVAARPSRNYLENPFNEYEVVRSAAMKRLLEVFGMEDPPAVHGHKQPPQYMLDLYNTVADVDGVTKYPNLLEGNTVRSFYDRMHSGQVELRFDLSTVARTEKILTGELHLFKLQPQSTQTVNRYNLSQVSVYQVFNATKSNTTQESKLLSSRLVSVHSTGWEVFTITQAVRSWMLDEDSNLVLQVVVKGLRGSLQADAKLTQFASGRDHHQSKHPMLVLFTDDGRHPTSLESSDPNDATATESVPHAQNAFFFPPSDPNDATATESVPHAQNAFFFPPSAPNDATATESVPHAQNAVFFPPSAPNDTTATESVPHAPLSDPPSRSARSLDSSEEEAASMSCQRLPLYVDFEEIGWSDWIISPRGYNAYHCKGSCPFPLGQNMRPTNHATVQSIINALKLVQGIETPCCVPEKLFSINLLYFDDDENVVLKQYNDMVAGSCGCH